MRAAIRPKATILTKAQGSQCGLSRVYLFHCVSYFLLPNFTNYLSHFLSLFVT